MDNINNTKTLIRKRFEITEEAYLTERLN